MLDHGFARMRRIEGQAKANAGILHCVQDDAKGNGNSERQPQQRKATATVKGNGNSERQPQTRSGMTNKKGKDVIQGSFASLKMTAKNKQRR